ncbi:MAG TPA: UbiA family prenyltransferase [Draconibacterium sp.]|nr:UbiA family prenyltransferase [Draconibacterium sp.]
MKLVNTFIYTHFFLSVAAVLLTVSAQIQLGMKPQWQPYLLLIFMATFFVYNWHNLIIALTKKLTLYSGSNSWIRNNLKWLCLLLFLALAGFVVVIIPMKSEGLLTIVIMGILTFFYSVPVSENNSYFFNLRKIPYLKIFVIVSVWASSTVLLPVLQAGEDIFNAQVILLFAERFFFVFAIAIPFDIRDMYADRDAGLKTIPLLINQKKALVLSYLSLLFCFLISFYHYRMQNKWFVIEALCISLITTYLFLKIQFFKNLGRYYYQVLDGALLLQGILVLSFYLLTHS